MININLKKLINDYLFDVEQGLSLFQKKIGDKNPLKAWRDGDIPQKGKLNDVVRYELHGIGCLLVFPDYEVDFDFGPGYRSDGFDLWRLFRYVLARGGKYPDYKNVRNLENDFNESIKTGGIIKIGHTYCNLYFLSEKE